LRGVARAIKGGAQVVCPIEKRGSLRNEILHPLCRASTGSPTGERALVALSPAGIGVTDRGE
jgi:hypothetical protein